MRKNLIVLALICLATTATVYGQCAISVTGPRAAVTSGATFRISWNGVPGAAYYRVSDSSNANVTPQFDAPQTSTTSMDFVRTVTVDRLHHFLVAAYNSNDALICSGTVTVGLLADEAANRFLRRSIIPVAGSAPGANGAMFKTALTLRSDSPVKGRVWFRPMGQAPSANDHSIAYDLGASDRVHWDDVVAAMGASGIGYLEIIPDPSTTPRVPYAMTRVYNETAQGTFGDMVQWNRVSDIAKVGATPNHIQMMNIEYPTDSRMRLNVGFVALEYIDVALGVRRDGVMRQSKVVHLFPGEMRMGNPKQVFELQSWEPGDELFLQFRNGAVLPFYTLTDNGTNDPTVFVNIQPSTSNDVLQP
jgi:hypothetical protein